MREEDDKGGRRMRRWIVKLMVTDGRPHVKYDARRARVIHAVNQLTKVLTQEGFIVSKQRVRKKWW